MPHGIVGAGRLHVFPHADEALRVYVIEERAKLSAFLDVFKQGRLLVAQGGFGMLASKRLQWFAHAGVQVGELTTRDPIRAIYATPVVRLSGLAGIGSRCLAL